MSALVFALFVPKAGPLKLNLGGDKYSLYVHALLFAVAHRAVSHVVEMVVKPALCLATTVGKDVVEDSGLYGKNGHGQRMY
jgi:hypothetical protein